MKVRCYSVQAAFKDANSRFPLQIFYCFSNALAKVRTASS